MAHTDETALLLAARGDARDAVETLLAQYQPLLRSMALRYHSLADAAAEYEDFFQEANIAFLHAIRIYNVAQSDVTFGLYAKICIRNRLVSKLRSWKSHASATAERMAQAPDPADKLIDRESYNDLLDRIACLLSKREMDVFRLYLLGKSYTEISQALGITEKSVDNALFRMKAKLKKAGMHI